jgi:drug/metabolite transporter (DMT)-like permease
MIPMSLSFTAMTYSFLVAMVLGSETTTIWLQYVGPAWVAIAGLLGMGDRPRPSDALMIILSLAGIAVIVAMESIGGTGRVAGGPVGLALFSGVMYAGVVLAIRHLRGVDVAWLGLVNHAWALRQVESNEAALITLIEPIAVPVWTFLAWRHHPEYEFPRWWTMLGASLIAMGFLWRYGIAPRLSRVNRCPPGEEMSDG